MACKGQTAKVFTDQTLKASRYSQRTKRDMNLFNVVQLGID